MTGYPVVSYRPTLIDAAYVGFISDASEAPVVMPALNRDGDWPSNLALALFGSIAGAESLLLALGAAADGIRATDLGASASTTEVVDEIIARVRWSRHHPDPPDRFVN